MELGVDSAQMVPALHTLVKDPETGFLTAQSLGTQSGLKFFMPGHGIQSESIFDPTRKQEFLKILSEMFPNISASCHSIGISRQTFRNHYEMDEVFRNAVDEIKNRKVDFIDGVRYEVAATKSGSFDRMCVLNAQRAETYNPKQTIEIQHTGTTVDAQARVKRMEQAIDAEVVETVARLKAAKKKASRP